MTAAEIELYAALTGAGMCVLGLLAAGFLYWRYERKRGQ